jgi:hypothetical protein
MLVSKMMQYVNDTSLMNLADIESQSHIDSDKDEQEYFLSGSLWQQQRREEFRNGPCC